MKIKRTLAITIAAILVLFGAVLLLAKYHNPSKFIIAPIAPSKPSIHKTEQLPERIITPTQKTEFAKQASDTPIMEVNMFQKPGESAAPDIIEEDVADDPLIAEKMRKDVERLHMAHLPPRPVYELIEEEVNAMNAPRREETNKLDRIAREGKIPEDADEDAAE